MPFSPIEEIIEDIKAGKMVIVCDDEDRENEGDLTMAAELVTAEDINFMATHGRGLICLPMAGEIVDRLDIPEMVTHNSSRMGTAFTASIEAKDGHHHRHLRRRQGPHLPGRRGRGDRPRGPRHAWPRLPPAGEARRRLAARRPDRGRRGPRQARRPEAGWRDLRDHERGRHDGPGARPREVLQGARRQDGDRRPRSSSTATPTRRRSRAPSRPSLPTPFGEFRLRAYENEIDDLTHVALVMGEPEGKDDVLVRVHSACLTGDALHSLALRLRRAARGGHGDHRRRGRGRHRLHAAGGPRHRAPQQDEGLPPPGRGHGHRRGQPEARPRPGPAGLRRGGPDPQGPRPASASAS